MTTLEKIRTEVANLTCDCINYMVNQYAVLQFIDKYAEQEPNGDVVSRQAVLALAQDSCLDLDLFEDTKEFCDEIKELPSIILQPRWIPVSERLPEIHQDVLVSLRSLDVEVGFRAETEPCFYCEGDYIEIQNVLAWMPLPGPYKAESEE